MMGGVEADTKLEILFELTFMKGFGPPRVLSGAEADPE
jgi:hypothetical protein